MIDLFILESQPNRNRIPCTNMEQMTGGGVLNYSVSIILQFPLPPRVSPFRGCNWKPGYLLGTLLLGLLWTHNCFLSITRLPKSLLSFGLSIFTLYLASYPLFPFIFKICKYYKEKNGQITCGFLFSRILVSQFLAVLVAQSFSFCLLVVGNWKHADSLLSVQMDSASIKNQSMS